MKISIPEFIHGGTSKTRNGTISSLFRRIGMSGEGWLMWAKNL